jgi:hypothetical protein
MATDIDQFIKQSKKPTPLEYNNVKGEFMCEPPNKDLHSFKGLITINDIKFPMSAE